MCASDVGVYDACKPQPACNALQASRMSAIVAFFARRDNTGSTALHYAPGADIEAQTLLVSYGIQLDAVDDNGESALMLAAQERESAFVDLLCTAGANVHLVNNDGESALMKAAFSCFNQPLPPATFSSCSDMMTKLVQWGCQVNIQDLSGQTALHHCLLHNGSETWSDAADCFSVLMELGADVNIQDASGMNALHLAIDSGWPLDTICLLAEKVVDINAADSCGNTALMYAVEEQGDDAADVVRILLERQANLNSRSKLWLCLNAWHP